MIAFGTLSGGTGAALTGGNFWQGAVTGLVVSGLNHAMHEIDPPGKRKASWDNNGDGKLQKREADNWYLYGKGKGINVDNSKIDWSGLKMPLTGNTKFAIGTIDAFTDLPWETSSTYGGTSFERTSPHTAIVKDQSYHYKLRPNNSLGNIGRNIMNEIGKPSGINYSSTGVPLQSIIGKPFIIHYTNPTIRFK